MSTVTLTKAKRIRYEGQLQTMLDQRNSDIYITADHAARDYFDGVIERHITGTPDASFSRLVGHKCRASNGLRLVKPGSRPRTVPRRGAT
jgi:hypothetical protein